jgi:hypothetical protein
MTRNEGRARLNLPRMDDPSADELVLPLNEAVSGQVPAPLEPIEGEPTDIDEIVGGLLARTIAHFMARQEAALRSHPDRGFDRPRWERELHTDLARVIPKGELCRPKTDPPD